jgi:hypothetical protein
VSITTLAYSLCKTVVKAPVREELRDLIGSLNVSSSQGGVDRSQFGYVAARQQCQVLGYLVVDQERGRIEAGPLPLVIPPLSDTERELLGSAQAEIVSLNQQCVEAVVSRWPVVRTALDPYSDRPTLALSTNLGPKRIFNDEKVAALAEEFARHSDIRAILSARSDLVGLYDANTTHQAVRTLLGLIRQAGAGHVPSAIKQTVFQLPHNHPQRAVTQYLAALMSVRESLRNLDQMVYQAILADKPPIMDEDSIIAMSGTHGDVLGTSSVITYQPDESTFLLEPGDLAVVKQIPNYTLFGGLVQVEDLRFSHSINYGSTNTVTVRLLNEDLSPFGRLVQQF